MNEQIKKSLSYVSDFLTFLFLERLITDKILAIYIFGSSVRGELEEKSDIDVFIECEEQYETLVKTSSAMAEKNFRISKDFDKWKHMNFTYPFSIKTGPLKDWQLKSSIKSEGMQMFSKIPQQENLERLVLFKISFPKNKKQYLSLTRKLFGRKEKGYRSKGLLERANGKAISSNTFIVQKSFQTEIIDFLNKNKTSFSMLEVLKEGHL